MADTPDMVAGISRRTFLKRFLAGAGAFAVTASAIPFSPRPASADGPKLSFPQGVASGDPQPDAVMLWTRALPSDGSLGRVPVRLHVSKDRDFRKIVAEQIVVIGSDSDHTARIFVDGLEPDTVYYYRFLPDGDTPDLIGRTRTAPAPDDARPVNFAIVSCQDYEGGFSDQGWYRLIADDEAASPDTQLDFVLHLGDFVYESIAYKIIMDHGTVEADAVGDALRTAGDELRRVPPFPSGGGERPGGQRYAVTLDDYRHLYKTYLSDPGLKAARARWPFVSTWDDHEFTNDSWQSHDTFVGEGVGAQRRKVAANRAWFEYMPAILSESGGPASDFTTVDVDDVGFGSDGQPAAHTEPNNRAAIGSMTIYRTLRFGALVDLVVTDTRSYRSDHPVPEDLARELANTGRGLLPAPAVRTFDAGKTANGSNPPETVESAGRSVPNRRRNSPPGTVLGTAQKDWWKRSMQESTAAWKLWANSIPAFSLRMDFSSLGAGADDAVLTSDSWSGYPTELSELMGFLSDERIANVVSLAGDHHMNFASIVSVDRDAEQQKRTMPEFSVSGMSSVSAFRLIAYLTRENGLLQSLTISPHGTGGQDFSENLNMTFLDGVGAAIISSQTGNVQAARASANPNANPGLGYIDSNANGYGRVRATVDKLEVELVTIETPLRDRGSAAAPVARRARFTVPKLEPGDTPVLNGPEIEGRPPFPLA